MEYYSKIIWICGMLLLISCQQQRTIERVEKDMTPISIKGLQNRTYETQLSHEKVLQGTDDYNADLMSYYSDSLKIYALVTTPKTEAPKEGFPILIFGHGFHPEPKKYGISTSTGKEWRPGDYYRAIPEAFAAEGYLVVTPDYRGHNTSDGFEFTQKKFIASNFYTIDVLNLLEGIDALKQANLDQIYYLGHSMGGDVGLRMLLVSNKIKAASLWSAVLASTTEQALYYGHANDESKSVVDNDKMIAYTDGLNQGISSLGFDYKTSSGDAIYFIDDLKVPLIIQHARGDKSVPYAWSESLVSKLFELDKPFEFYSYSSENHLFQNENFDTAVQRDIQFFKKHLK
jgi:dipeptidyl aminopeptidase/acylaminoacyl peptidase